jgi:phosphonate degradation associated HDIG domain protein
MNKQNDSRLRKVISPTASPTENTDALFELMHRFGHSFYDESVTQLEHALQAAQLARSSGAAPALVVTALLHDIGHFLTDENTPQGNFFEDDWLHEAVGADYLSDCFGKSITEPIRLHVPAKRYLCTTNSDYFMGLSRASRRSFELQGGKMTDAEIAEFRSSPFCENAVLLRRWDDQAKVTAREVDDLQSYRQDVASCLSDTTSSV